MPPSETVRLMALSDGWGNQGQAKQQGSEAFMNQEDGLAWPPPHFSKPSYLFVSLGEVGPTHFIHSHDDGHHVLPVHYGGSQDILGLVLREGVHEVTEMFILKGGRETSWVGR